MKSNFIVIQGWMVKDLNLSGNDLLLYALIYGFSQDEESEFKGSINYICDWLNCSRPTAIKAINNLVEKQLIFKHKTTVSNVHFNTYKANLLVVKKLYFASKETLLGGSKETLPNNIEDNNIVDNIDKKKMFEIFWEKYPNKVAKDNCMKKFMKLPAADIEKILATLDAFLAHKMFEGYVHPLPMTYLNQKRWNDEIKPNKNQTPQLTEEQLSQQQKIARLKTLTQQPLL